MAATLTPSISNEIHPDARAISPRTDSEPAIQVQNVSKTYPVPLLKLKRLLRRRVQEPVQALSDVSFDVHPGEVFGLIGRNGAGKTTLTKIIATLVRPTEGCVRVTGFDSAQDEERVRASVGLAATEERSFYWRLTATQNLMFFARLYGLTERAARARTDELLEQFELTQNARRHFGELSTGNKQRMAVARAMLARPAVLLLDEPTRSLDPLAAARMRQLIGELAAGRGGEQHTTVLLTSHNLSEIEELCPRVGVITRGRLRAIDTPENLRLMHPQQEQVRIRFNGIDDEHAFNLLRAALDADVSGANPQLTSDDAAAATLLLTRRANDEQLDAAFRVLHRHGGRVLACDTERATLLDVLEAYESEAGEDHVRE